MRTGSPFPRNPGRVPVEITHTFVLWKRDGSPKVISPPSTQQRLLNELISLVNSCEAHGLFITGPARSAIKAAT